MTLVSYSWCTMNMQHQGLRPTWLIKCIPFITYFCLISIFEATPLTEEGLWAIWKIWCMWGSRRTCILHCLVALTISGGRIHYEAAYYLPKKKVAAFHGRPFFFCSSTISIFAPPAFENNTAAVSLQRHNADERTTTRSDVSAKKRETRTRAALSGDISQKGT